jgi:hypothetical protein
MRGLTRRAAMVMVVLGTVTSTAGAVTWHNTGDTAFTSSGSAMTLSVTGVSLTCTGASATGTSPSGSTVGVIYSGASGTLTLNGCSLSGLPTSVGCDYTWTLSTDTGGIKEGTADLTCSITQFGTKICHVEGPAPVTHFDPVPPSGFEVWIIHDSSGLKTTNGPGGTCPLGAGEPAHITKLTMTTTSATGGPTPHLGPRFTRTA